MLDDLIEGPCELAELVAAAHVHARREVPAADPHGDGAELFDRSHQPGSDQQAERERGPDGRDAAQEQPAARAGQRGLIAGDLIAELHRAVNEPWK